MELEQQLLLYIEIDLNSTEKMLSTTLTRQIKLSNLIEYQKNMIDKTKEDMEIYMSNVEESLMQDNQKFMENR